MKHMAGVTLLEVLLAIVIFVIGMLALAHLQTNLTRSSTDANTRTVATNIGEEVLEALRAFRRVSTDPDGVLFAFADIDDDYVVSLTPPPRGGINYTVAGEVIGYNFISENTLSQPIPAVAGTVYDFKVVNLTVTWDNNQAFEIDENTQLTKEAVGTGAIEITALIPSIPALTAAKVAAEDDGILGYVPTPYQPGNRPDIIQIDLEDGKFKESTTPQPDVIRNNELVETWFDVVTYNQGVNEALFIRREEFLVVSCSCSLREPSGDETTGFLPTVWNGTEYVVGTEFDDAGLPLQVSKTYGESASNQNSAYCDVCCRDHHDSTSYGSADQLYDPAMEWTEAAANGDHKHFNRSNQGVLAEATSDGDEYMEACRMVRKDGFMRVAQDFRQEGLFAFPAGYLDLQAGAEEYASYVTDAVSDFYENDRGALTAPDGTSDPMNPAAGFTYTFPASTTDNPTGLPTELGLDSQQLRSRGIYIDHVSADAEALIDCIMDDPGNCEDAPGVENYLEVLPFFEIQTTFLSWWTENSNENPVAVSNEALETNNTHSRGLAERVTSTPAEVTVNTQIQRGNVGLAGIDAIDPLQVPTVAPSRANYVLFISANGGGNPPIPTGDTWSGTFTSGVGGVNASDAILTPGSNTNCARSGTSIACTTDFGVGGSLVISDYYKNAVTSLWICGSGTGITIVNGDPTAALKSATVSWPAGTSSTDVVLYISNSSCT
jgi:type II secretory pathway pseudopilin PulG